jgi:excinuclease ABC subunit A
MDKILIRGARTHNLKNIDITLPRDQLIVITGLSGSGKSSLAFDTIYAEGQRRYVESLSAYARQFLSMLEKPDIDHIEGLSPAISIEQKSTSHNPRSTVGTITEIHDYLRLLYARIGIPRCPEHHIDLNAQTVSQIVDSILLLPEETRIMLLAPVVDERKGEHHLLLEQLKSQGYIRARINGTVVDLDSPPALELHHKHTIEVVIDRLKVREENRTRLAESIETALTLSDGTLRLVNLDTPDTPDQVFSSRFACPVCGYSVAELEPRLFSFNNPAGACPSCDGLGKIIFFDPDRIVAHPDLSLTEGAIKGWDKRNPFYFQLIQSLARHYHFSPDTPFNALPKKVQKVLLYGSNGEKIHFKYDGFRSGKVEKHHAFEGIVTNMERRYRDTDSNAMREELGKYQSTRQCPDCAGQRLNQAARHVLVAEHSLPQISAMSIAAAHSFFNEVSFEGYRAKVAEKIILEIQNRLGFLINVGLDYLSLDRSAETLSGGEAQRIRLASQIGAGLVGVMYVLDEPSIGLHQRDNQRLLETLRYLKNLGNTVIVVEHDEEAIRDADHIVDIGPGAGVHGGRIVAQGSLQEIMDAPESITGDYLSGRAAIPVPKQRTPFDPEKVLRIIGASGNNLKHICVDIPAGLMTCITGVSGSGKSTLINDTLYAYAAYHINRASLTPAPYERIENIDLFDKIVDIDQSPIGRTPRSNPATYTGLFTPIRELFSHTPEARARGYQPGRFSFNIKGGRCEACQGDGVIRVEMHFLPDIYVPCDVCHGKRYNRETLEITYKGKTIHDVLDMTVEDALTFFKPVPSIARKLETLMDVGLSYIKLGQNATTLSGGEAQRIKLSRELSKRGTGRTLYILDEPTTGLHFHDIQLLLNVLHQLRDQGNTILVIEHNLDVIKTADWIIDLGPEGGNGGGEVLICGTPEQVAQCATSYTGEYLKPMLTSTSSQKTSKNSSMRASKKTSK